MTRRLASFLLLLLMASSGAYATPAPRLSNSVRIEFSFREQVKAETPLQRTAALGYPSERPSWYSTDSPRVRTGISQALFQRPPPAAR